MLLLLLLLLQLEGMLSYIKRTESERRRNSLYRTELICGANWICLCNNTAQDWDWFLFSLLKFSTKRHRKGQSFLYRGVS